MNSKLSLLVAGTLLAQVTVSSAQTADPENAVNVYEKMRSFSCAISKNSQTLHLIWSDDPPNPPVPRYREAANSIRLVTHVLPDAQTVKGDHHVEVVYDKELRINVDGRPIEIDRLRVEEISNLPFHNPASTYRSANNVEIQSIASAISRNIIACMKKSYFFVGLNDELQ
jgi:hypothetical protein